MSKHHWKRSVVLIVFQKVSCILEHMGICPVRPPTTQSSHGTSHLMALMTSSPPSNQPKARLFKASTPIKTSSFSRLSQNARSSSSLKTNQQGKRKRVRSLFRKRVRIAATAPMVGLVFPSHLWTPSVSISVSRLWMRVRPMRVYLWWSTTKSNSLWSKWLYKRSSVAYFIDFYWFNLAKSLKNNKEGSIYMYISMICYFSINLWWDFILNQKNLCSISFHMPYLIFQYIRYYKNLNTYSLATMFYPITPQKRTPQHLLDDSLFSPFPQVPSQRKSHSLTLTLELLTSPLPATHDLFSQLLTEPTSALRCETMEEEPI